MKGAPVVTGTITGAAIGVITGDTTGGATGTAKGVATVGAVAAGATTMVADTGAAMGDTTVDSIWIENETDTSGNCVPDCLVPVKGRTVIV